LMHPVQHRPEFGGRVGRACLWHRGHPEQAPEVGPEECGIATLLAANAPQGQAILPVGDVPHLPGDVADAARRLLKPLGCRGLVEQSDGVVASEDDLFDRQLKSRHGYFSFAGSVRTNLVARSIQPFNCSWSSTPFGSTSTQPFIALPVMSNSRTCGSRSAS